MASVYRGVGLPLPDRLPYAREDTRRRFANLLAQYMPFDLVIDEQTPDGQEARVSKTSVCGSWGPIAGELRYFADRFGIPRASIEGTQVPIELLQRYATRGAGEVVYDPRRKNGSLALRRTLQYHGFELDREYGPIDEFPPELEDRIRSLLADSLARGEARHSALKRHRSVIEELREVYRRSGGVTPRLGVAELTPLYERALQGVRSMDAFRASPLAIDFDAIVSPEDRARYRALPDAVDIRGRTVPIDYDVEEVSGTLRGVARLRLPEKLARTMTEEELPELDRPVRFTVLRGPRGAVRATTLAELQDMLDRPWSPDEVTRDERSSDLTPRDERRVRELAGELRREKRPPRGRAGRRGDGSGPRHRGGSGDGAQPRGRGPGGNVPRGRRRRGR